MNLCLFAGKLHALLCREYVKGRDWYDLIGYTARRTPVNYALLTTSLNQAGPWRGKNVKSERTWCVRELGAKIKTMDWKAVRADVRRFVPGGELPSLKLRGTELFLGQCEKIA
jgi:hypothetical protein